MKYITLNSINANSNHHYHLKTYRVNDTKIQQYIRRF